MNQATTTIRLLQCRCGLTVIATNDSAIWCLKCARRMQPIISRVMGDAKARREP